VIKNMAISRLKEFRLIAKGTYNKLDDWISLSIKAENDAVYELTKILRRAIEKQEKVQKELLLNYVDVVVNFKYLNFLTPPPIILPAKEVKSPSRFTITQLYLILEELKSLANDNDFIDSKVLLQFFVRRTASNLCKDDFPSDWQLKESSHYQKILKNLDNKNLGYISLKVLSTYLCLLSTHMPMDMDLNEYKKVLDMNAKNGLVGRDAFCDLYAWFDGYETCPHSEHNSMFFNRVQMIKGLLFQINKEKDKDELHIDSFLRNIRPIEIIHDFNASPSKSDGRKSPTRSPNKSMLNLFVKTYSNLLFD